MSSSGASRERELVRLERELEGGEYQSLLQRLREQEPFYRQFDAWQDVLEFLRGAKKGDARCDLILRPIFRAHRTDSNPLWRTVLLTIFWRGLRAICSQKWAWNRDAQERWQSVTWAFLEVISELNVAARPDRLVQAVMNNTVSRLYRECQSGWQLADVEAATDRQELEEQAEGIEGASYADQEDRLSAKDFVRWLLEHAANGLLSEADLQLIIETRMSGESTAAYARRHGLSHEAVRKRRQRAERILSSNKEIREKLRDFMSQSGR